MRSAIILKLLLLTLLPFAGIGQRYNFEKITEDNGLSDNRVTCFMKDKAGFMWIGTENGLNRYDGNEFRIYRPGQKQFNLSHEHINDIEQDRRGNLWISTWSGLAVLNPETDSLLIFSPDHDAFRQKKTRIASSLVWDTFVENEKRTWIALDVRDLCYYDVDTDEFVYFPWQEFVKQNSSGRQNKNPYSSIQKIARKSDHEVWLGTTRGLYSFDIREKKFLYYGGDDAEDFVSLHVDSARHQVFFAQQNLYVYDERSATLSEFVHENEKIQPRKSTLLLPSLSGLWEIEPESKKAFPVRLVEKKSFTVHHAVVTAVLQQDNTDWIGTSDGVRLHNRNLDLFRFTAVFDDSVKATSGNVYRVLDHSHDNAYYLSSYTKHMLIVIDKRTGDKKEIRFIDGKPLRHCSRTYEDSRGRLWVLTERYIFVSNTRHTDFTVFPYPAKDGNYLFNDMLEDQEGNFWFSSLREGVFFYNTSKQTWKFFEVDPNGLFATRPTGFLSDSANHALWISDFSFGAFNYDFTTKNFNYNGMDIGDPEKLQSSLTTDLAIDNNGDIWVSTSSGGVSRYSQRDKTFTTYSMKTGLPENTIHSVEADRNGNLWLASHKGLTCIKPTGEIIKHYDQNSSLPFANFNTPITTNDKGEMFIGIAHGFLSFHPDSLVADSYDFPMVITAAEVSGTSLLRESDMRFPYDQNEFTAQFSALTYSMPARVTYFYQLEGFDRTWIQAAGKHSANYTNLDNGSYTFKVKAVDHTGRSSLNTASIQFIIRAPFWKTWWFVGLVSTLAVVSLFLWIRSLQQKIRSQKILNQVATSLYNQSTYEEVFWTVAQSCVDLLTFEDCVVYLLDDRGVLIQKAAGGPKNKHPYQVHEPIEIPLGKGIVGAVALSGKAEIVNDTARDNRYIIDDQSRLSEIAVPILVDGKVFGVIDSEHSRKNFYSAWQMKMLNEIAAICSAKISRYFVEEQIRSKVARDLHDDMGSSLSSINIMSKIALEKDEPIISQNYLKSIRENAAQMQESLSDMVWAINPQNDTMEKVIIKMKEFTAEILEPLDIQFEFVEEGDFNFTKMNIDTRKDFYLIFKEAINNAAKYSACRTVVVHLSHLPNVLKLQIRDDGKGFVQPLNGSGNGLKNMRHRARIIHAELSIESTPGQGSNIQLILPFK